ncbi:hypothetical protein KKH15_02970 [Patescibacteria group bacterium]|nr:hypothetical protein [Patescibacteria group bacterium]MBU1755059.1 hypothetical protein [Patescibacteria group bacterium]
MALPPTIPTSFVPKQATAQKRRRFSGTSGMFYTIALIILGLSVTAAAATFGFEYYLKTVRDAKVAELTKAEANISEDTVEEFVRLRDRFSSAEILINNHVSFTQFFDTLERLTLTSVRFNSLSAIVEEDRTVKVEMDGTARNFNALAAQSAAFAGENRIKRAIFSDIGLNTGNAISFTLTAELDPRLIITAVGEAPITVEEAPVEAPAPAEVIEPAAATTTPL